ncbi:MAG: FHA domain-containing protein [Chloroflexota bacterium]
MSTPKPRLVVRRGPNPDHVYLLQNDTTIVGREPINDAMFPDPEVSRRHCRIVQQKGEYFIEDLNSTNGTFVNGRRIFEITRLSSGDIIDFGETVRVVFEYLLPLNGDDSEIANDPRLQGFKDPNYAQAGSYKTIPPYSSRPSATSDQDYYAQLEPTIAEQQDSYQDGLGLRPWQSWIIGGTLALLVIGMCLCGGLLYYLDTNQPDLLWGWLTG